MKSDLNFAKASLKRGDIGVLKTDTIYGLVGSALNEETVKRIYTVRRRNPKKPLIILIGSLRDLHLFGIELSPRVRGILKRIWPGPISVILPCEQKKFSYLHRGTNSLAFRMPKKDALQHLLKATGPLVAPSANPEGLPPSNSIQDAYAYFGDTIDFYVNGGNKKGEPSTIIEIKR